ncbi:1,4-dihydroxy-2-naphthoyl-CoA hydrolase [Cyclobacterium lianum]|uniref:1,4-dihydroxy-2-naphthoyl-CoA hydrolase n=1 Tax=Cyclobacterium lianum TaxID=388280 RepID=A0A1M7QRF5_9BACT|nr:hotdog fold thioesterase [Cyclobacterium lianum]SHN34195.1 1,4-dihydroxy-2-naphthoyl-CoA hydrolase [Cyclobacterium lianum]
MIFREKPDLDFLNQLGKDSMTGFLDIRYTAFGDDFLEATMPVTAKTKQPFGLLHGGASVVLAESLGSLAAFLTLEKDKYYAVGLEINANHLRPVKDGLIRGRATTIHLGRKTQVWEIKIKDSADILSCISRITLAILEK